MDLELATYLIERGHSKKELFYVNNAPYSQLYNIYNIRQGRSGKKRRIEEPCAALKKVQQDLIPLFDKFLFHPACMALKGKSIADNARVHEDAKHVLRVDIKKCYPSVRMTHVRKALEGADIEVGSTLISALCFCFLQLNGTESILPTGAPTSPVLCNIALTPIDKEVSKLAEEYGYKYTRYMDDLHLSTSRAKREWCLLPMVGEILEKHRFKTNTKKSRWYTNQAIDSIIITGVRVGTDCKVPREFRRMMRARLQNLAMARKEIDQEARGCLAYIKSIDNKRYHQLLEYYERRRAYVPSS